MNKLVHSIVIIFLLAPVFYLVSCTKSDSLHNPPSNLLLSAMNVTTVDSPSNYTIVENYSFLYDSINRLTEVIYTTDDTSVYDIVSTFRYAPDSIIKTVNYKYIHDAFKEVDYFLLTPANYINNIITPTNTTLCQYFGKLVSVITNQTNSTTTTFKSYSGDNLYSILDSNGVNYTFDNLYYGYTNRIGDYLQLNSFATYGFNIYQNAHMIQSISGIYGSTNVIYKIDANNVVTETDVYNRYLSGISFSPGGIVNLTQKQKYVLSYQNY